MRTLCSITIYFLSLILFSAYAQGPVVKNYTTSDGLASNTVYFSMQDSHGFIWFATDNGVSRFDGTRFKNYTVADGLSDNTVLKIVEDAEGRVWFLTFSGKLSFYQNDKIYNSSNSELLRQLNFKAFINYFFEDSKKNIWINSMDYTNVKISPGDKVKRFSTYFICRYIWEDSHGQIGFLGFHELFFLKDTTFTHKHLITVAGCAVSLPGDTSLLAANDSSLETINYAGKDVPIKGEKKYTDVKYLCVLRHNNSYDVWATGLNGAIEFENGIISPANEHCYLENYALTSVAKDKDGNLWFSSVRSGVFMIPSPGIHLYDINSGLADNAVTTLAILEDSSLMVGTFNGSLQLIDHGVVKKIHPPFVSSPGEILTIKEDKTGTAWVLSERAMYKYRSGKFSAINEHGYNWNKTLFISRDNVPWLGNARGINKIIKDSLDSVYRGDINRVYAIEQLKDNEFILGTEKGLYHFKNGKMMPYPLKNSLLTHWVNALAFTADATLWIATDAYGLLSLKNNKVTQYTTKEQLLSNKCNNLFADSNKLYVATGNGLNLVSEENNRVHISSFSLGTGLISNHINQVIKKNKNTIVLGTDRGVVEFDIRTIPVSYVSNPYLFSLMVNDSERTLTNSYRFNYNENDITIEFGAINFNSPGNIYYRYKLNGQDTGWNYTTYTAIKYSSLRPGNYSFVVAAQNTNGNWNPKTASISFYIETPWWQTWWFRLLVVLAIAATITLTVIWRIRVYKEKVDRKRALSESELKALRAQINPHFVYNSLSAIQELVLQNQKENANIYFSKFASLLRSILNNSRVSEITLKEELDSMQLYLELEVLRYDAGFDFAFDLGAGVKPEEIYIPSMILQPFIENAVLHGLAPLKKGGTLSIKFKLTNGYVICTIEDNGIGRKKAAEAKLKSSGQIRPSLGMLITRERIDLINTRQKQKINLEISDLADETGNPRGTRVTIFFPLDETTVN